MKLIRAIIQPHRLDVVRDALNKAGLVGLTSYEVKGFGRQKGHKEIYRGAEYTISYRPKVNVDIVVEDEKVEIAIDAIVDASRSGQTGDGKIFILNVEDAIRIRTGERNETAL